MVKILPDKLVVAAGADKRFPRVPKGSENRKPTRRTVTFSDLGMRENVIQEQGDVYLKAMGYTKLEIQRFLDSWHSSHKLPGK